MCYFVVKIFYPIQTSFSIYAFLGNPQLFIITPAIESTELDEKIKASVKNTAERLSKKPSAREIVDFFNDALLANKEKEIYQAFHKIGLKGFEDIGYLIEEAYYS